MFEGVARYFPSMQTGEVASVKAAGKSFAVKASKGYATVEIKVDSKDSIMLPGDLPINDVPGGFGLLEIKSLDDNNNVSVVVTNAHIG